MGNLISKQKQSIDNHQIGGGDTYIYDGKNYDTYYEAYEDWIKNNPVIEPIGELIQSLPNSYGWSYDKAYADWVINNPVRKQMKEPFQFSQFGWYYQGNRYEHPYQLPEHGLDKLNKRQLPIKIPIKIPIEVTNIDNNYSINLMWINKQLNTNQKYIFVLEDDSLKELQDKYLNFINDWCIKNPNIIIKVWYNSNTTTQRSIQNTRDAMDKSYPNNKNYDFVDLMSIKSIRDANDKQLQNEYISLYFKTDLFRIMVAYDDIANSGINNSIFANINMPAITKDELFDKNTIENLNFYGTVMSCNLSENCGTLGFENSFFIIANKPNTRILESVHFYIKLLINIITQFIKYVMSKTSNIQLIKKFINELSSQLVYDLYPLLFLHNYIIRGFIAYKDDNGKEIRGMVDNIYIDKHIINAIGKISRSRIRIDTDDILKVERDTIPDEFLEEIKNPHYTEQGYGISTLWIIIPTKNIEQPASRKQYSQFEGNLPAAHKNKITEF